MKKLNIRTITPAFALLAVSCSSPIAMQSTEYDDMYYTSADKTAYIQPEAEAPSAQADEAYYGSTEEGEVSNPEYAGSSAIAGDYADDEYYDGREYNPRNNWSQSNYSFVDPYWGSAYVPRHYNRYSAMSSFYDPFYSPFYHDPFYYDPFMRTSPYWNRGLSFSLSYGLGGLGGFYNRPYYSSWYPYNSFYNGYNRGLYNGYYATNPYWYERPVVIGQPRNSIQYGPRGSRSVVATEDSRNLNSRPARTGAVNEGEGLRSAGSSNAEARPARPSRTSRTDQAVAPAGNDTKQVLPTRPSRSDYYNSRNSRRESQQPARISQPQQQRQLSPARESRSNRIQQSQPQRQVRPIESRPSRSFERSTPSRSFESTPSRSFESRPATSPTPRSSGGGRPSRGQ